MAELLENPRNQLINKLFPVLWPGRGSLQIVRRCDRRSIDLLEIKNSVLLLTGISVGRRLSLSALSGTCALAAMGENLGFTV